MGPNAREGTLNGVSNRVRSFLNDRASRPRPSYTYLPLSGASPVRPRNTVDEGSASWIATDVTTNDADESNSDDGNTALSTSTSHHESPTQDIESASQMGSTREGTRISIAWLYASIAAVAYVYSLDQNVTPNYLPIATSAYGRHSIIGTIFTAESIISRCYIHSAFMFCLAHERSTCPKYMMT